jgi:NADPH-dependent 2,4-dienoyl-CoA reductase/sulfur reductase-like enzyme
MAAARAKLADIDIIEIRAHSGYLTGDFLSPYFNRRVDIYGGSLENRLRFLLEQIDSARKNVGDDFPITVRFSIDECIEGGRGIKESQIIAKRLQEVGVNAISNSAGIAESGEYLIPPMYMPKGIGIAYAEAIKEVVDIPVIAAGRLSDPELAEEVLKNGQADFIGMGRQLLADPDLPRKLQEGRLEDIRYCIACNECRGLRKRPVRCSINATVGRDTAYGTLHKTEKARRVMVVGAGPGGLEAARVAGLRGHSVTLYEKSNELGGQLRLAMAPPFKVELKSILDYYNVQLKKMKNLKLKTGTQITADFVEKERPDVLIIATGSRPSVPQIKEISNDKVVTGHDVLEGKTLINDPVFLIGGSSKGCEIALFLAGLGRKVTIIEMLPELATDLEPYTRKCLLRELARNNVAAIVSKKVLEITDVGLRVKSKGSDIELLRCGTVVVCTGMDSVNELEDKLTGKIHSIYVIGDAKEPRLIRNAISEGYIAGYKC